MLEELPAAKRARTVDPEAKRASYRVAWSFPVEYTIGGIPGVHRATAADISAGGMLIATDILLRREWKLELQFTLPQSVLDMLVKHEPITTSVFGRQSAQKPKAAEQQAFAPMALEAEVTPGIQQARGRYLHGVKFNGVDAPIREELLRFVHAAQLSKRRLAM